MADSTIGIKVADGSYYPVLERGFAGRKKLVLTTARDNQPRVQIDLYRGDGSTLTDARYIGSLIIENIPAASQGSPEIAVTIGVDQDGQLSAEASDPSTGESQRFSTSLSTPSETADAAEPEFEIDDLEETGEKPGVAASPEEEEPLEQRKRKGPSLALLIIFVVLGLLVVLAVAYLVYTRIQGPQVQPLSPVTAPAATQPKPAPAATTPAAMTPAAQPAQGAAPAGTTASTDKPAAAKDVVYLIKKGDTLWDLASTYYRNPWLYPRLARANAIRNPDLILAGTRITIPAN